MWNMFREMDLQSPNRLEALTDGVVAIVITLLAFELTAPTPELVESRGLLRALLDNGATYLAFALSFMTLGVWWVSHNHLIKVCERADHVLMILNLGWLAAITLIPFATVLETQYLDTDDKAIATAMLGSVFCVAAVFYWLMVHRIRTHPELHRQNLDFERFKDKTARTYLGIVFYGVSVGVAFVDVRFSLLIQALLALYYVLPGRIY